MKKYIPAALLFLLGFLIFGVYYAQAATFYYNDATADDDWNTLGNWWMDPGFTVPATNIPGASDDVVIEGPVLVGPLTSVNSMVVNNALIGGFTMTVTNGATFNGTAANCGWIYGDVIFNDSSTNCSDVTGNATFNDSSYNDGGNIHGNAIFNNVSFNSGQVFVDAIFNYGTSNNGTVGGNATFNYLSTNSGTVSGNATFNEGTSNSTLAIVSGNATFNGTSFNMGMVLADAVFNNDSYNFTGGDVGGDTIFNDSAFNESGTVGNVTFNNSAHHNSSGIINGDATFNDTSYNNKGSIANNAVFNDSSYNDGYVAGNAIFNNSSYNKTGPDASAGNAFFYDLSWNGAEVNNDASFYDSSSNLVTGAVYGNACFATTATNSGTVVGTITPCSASTPTVTTDSSIVLSLSSAQLFGTITDTGGESANETGFEYGHTASYGSVINSLGSFVRGSFNNTISSASNLCGTWHFRAFATNSSGTSYGGDQTFNIQCGSGAVLPTCVAPEVLVNGACVVPPPTCTAPQVLLNGVCTTPTLICVAPEVLINGTCTLPPPPTCTTNQTLVNGVCVENVPTPTPTPTTTTQPKPTPVATTTTSSNGAPSSGGETIPVSSESISDVTSVPSSSTEAETAPSFKENAVKVAGVVLGATREVTNNPAVKLVANVATAVPVAASFVVLTASTLAGMPLTNYLFYLFVIFSQILGLKKKPKPWGTVYDSYTKKPIPFARVEILNEQSRKLQSTITDANGRYGFLISEELTNVQIRAYITKYDFASGEEPSVLEQKLYTNIYRGGLVNVSTELANFDIPMKPREKSINSNFYFGISSVRLNNLLVSLANILFGVGVTLGTANAIVNPSVASSSILALILITFILRVSGFRIKPFGLTKDAITNQALPFGLITVHNQTGERVNFTVSDERGRYFMLIPSGNYILKAFTPAHISPARTRELSIFTRKGWVSREVGV